MAKIRKAKKTTRSSVVKERFNGQYSDQPATATDVIAGDYTDYSARWQERDRGRGVAIIHGGIETIYGGLETAD
jgi:hypothetical protein